jgi:hypothetical protein
LELKRKKLNQYNNNKTDESSGKKKKVAKIDFKTLTASTKSEKSDSLKKKKRDKSVTHAQGGMEGFRGGGLEH